MNRSPSGNRFGRQYRTDAEMAGPGFFVRHPAICFALAALAVVALLGVSPKAYAASMTEEELGQALFFDVNLSKNRTQACATCHDPESGFADGRENASGGAFSLGDDGTSLGDRNAPTASYAAFTPPFGKTREGVYVGGLFHDGRAATLADQAGGPPLNAVEMGMPDKAAVVSRIRENDAYVEAFQAHFGRQVFEDDDTAYAAMTRAIQAFEQGAEFAPFDSKYDRALRGEYKMTPMEDLGMTLFFSNQFTNCNRCHQLKRFGGSEGETFANYEYHNIGVPSNVAARAANGVAPDHRDEGLFANPAVDDPAQKGKFKTITLRNVAVTGPYMHNGVFRELDTVIRFYNKYNAPFPGRLKNPETGEPWREAEVPENLSLEDLKQGDFLDEKRIKALVAFLKTLTDQRYEHLLEAE
ncbi:MAG: cytochrome-c peroxidase [Magnetovibrionaceae bacterium]